MTGLKKILIISFFFPPYNRVGGRRWAKHAKYLVSKGIEVQVIAGDFRDCSDLSHWNEDLETYKRNIYRVPLNKNEEPYFKRKIPLNFIQKLFWKASYYLYRFLKPVRLNSQGDLSYSNFNNFYNAAERFLATSEYSHVLLSVGPFYYSLILPKLKIKFPHLKYIVDFRDRWVEENHQLFHWQKRYQMRLMKKVISSVDLVLTVNPSISNDILKLSPDVKTATLMHAVDLEIKTVENSTKASLVPYIQLIYGGELYEGLGEEVKLCSEFVNRLAASHSHGAIASFYLHYANYGSVFQSSEYLKLLPKVEPSIFFTKLLSADLILLFRPYWSLDSFSSKFFEIVAVRKPILYFGHCGMVSEFIAENDLGWHVKIDNVLQVVSEVVENISSKNIPNPKYDWSQHSFENRTNELIQILEQV